MLYGGTHNGIMMLCHTQGIFQWPQGIIVAEIMMNATTIIILMYAARDAIIIIGIIL